MRLRSTCLFLWCCALLGLTASALAARPALFLLDEARLDEIRTLVTVPGTTHHEAYHALKARVDANHIPGTSSYQRGYMAREASFLYLLTGNAAYAQVAFDRLQEIYTISVPDGQAAPDAASGLGRAQTIASFAMAYNWAYEGLSPAQRDWVAGKVTSGLNQYAAQALSHPNIGYQANNSNWSGVVAGAHVMTLIAMGEERTRRFDFQRSRELLRTHLASFGDRGWTQEGNYYFGLSMEYLFPAMMALRQIGDPHVEPSFASRRPHHIIMYAGQFNAGQNSLTWGVGGDTLPPAGMTSALLALVPEGETGFYRWFYDRYRGIHNPAPPSAKYDYQAGGTIYALIGYPNSVPAEDPFGHYPTVINDSRGGYVMRSGWTDANDTIVSLWSDTGAYGRSWNQLDAGQINILSHGAKWGYGPGPATSGLDTAFSQILVNGLARAESGTGSAVEHRVAPQGGYAIVNGGSKFSNLGVAEAVRHVMADFSPEGFSIISTFDRLRANEVHTYAWNLFQPGMTVTVGTDTVYDVDYFLSVDANGAYLKAWFMVHGNGFITQNQATRYAYDAANIDIWVVMATGHGTPPAFSMVGSGLDAAVTLGNSVLTYNAATQRIESSTLTGLNRSTAPGLSANPTRGLAPLSVSFNGSGFVDTAETLVYSWDFGDGTTSTAQALSHTYANDGLYLVSLGVDDGNGGADRVVRDIFVGNREPTARITASATTVLPGVTITLDAGTSTDPENDPLTYQWFLGDGRTMTGQTIQVSWPTESTYQVELRAEDTAGNLNAARIAIRVENLPPVASFTFSSLGGFVPFSVDFDASASFDPEGDPLLYRWDFNDGTITETTHPLITHTFTQAKEHRVRLTVIDSAGKSHQVSRWITALGPQDIIASVEEPENLLQGLNYQVFRGDPTRGTNMPEITTLRPLNRGRISNYDLGVTNLANLYVLVFDGYIHIAETGAYAFRLRTRNETRIHIGGQIAVRSTYPHGSPTFESLVALEAGWHPFRIEATYNVEDAHEEWNRFDISWAPPGTDRYRPIPDSILFSQVSLFQPTFSATPATVYDGGTVMFESTFNSPDGLPLQYHWDFGDGNTSNQRRVAHTYHLPSELAHQVFNATLTATDSTGRSIVVGEQITVSRYAGLVMIPQTSITRTRHAFDQRTAPRDTTQAVNQVLEPGVELTFSSQLRPDLGGAMLGDGKFETRWVSENPEEWVMFRFTNRDGADRRVNITEYAFTAGGLPWTADRDPKDWEVYGSNNPQPFSMEPGAVNASWTLIDTVRDQAGVARSIPTIYSLPNDEAYSHYLFHLRNQSGGIDGRVELTEIQLFNYFEHDPNIDGNTAPVPTLAVSTNAGEAPLTVSFDASATVDPDGDWLYYTWDFGNGNVLRHLVERDRMEHTFYEPGIYSVLLTVTDALGKSAQISETITVAPSSPNAPPVAHISASDTILLAGSTVHFSAASTYDPDGDAMTFRWEFGDGAFATGESASHTYRKAGVYNPVLIVTDERGRVSSAFHTVEVLPPNGGRGVLSFNANDRARRMDFTRGAGVIPVGYWNNIRQSVSAGWYDSSGQPVNIHFSTTGNQAIFIAAHTVDPFNGDTVLAQINLGKQPWGSDTGFTLEVANIPYAVYDVYVYYAGANVDEPRAIDVNGIRRWAWKPGHDFPGQWRVSEAATAGEAIRGDNVILWRNLMGADMVLSIPQRNGEAISGFQIVDKTGSPDAPPIVSIESPANGDWFFLGEPIMLSGSGEDSDGPLDNPFLEWSSSIDGALGNGSTLSVGNLSVGTHTLTLTATNSANLQSTASVVIDVFSEPSAPVIVGHPPDTLSYETATIQFSVVATGSPPFFAYQWRKDGEPLDDGPRISGAGTHTLTLSGLTYDDEGAYDVVVTNSVGFAVSNPANLQVTELVAPQITSQPQGGTVNEGGELVLSVEVSGSAPFTFQWRRGGVPLANGGGVSGADTHTLRISGFGLPHEGVYDVVVTNAGGSVESAPASVFLFVLPSMEVVLAEWNFNQFASETVTTGFEESLPADLGSGILFVRSTQASGTNFARSPSGGTLINASDGTVAGGRIELRRNSRWDNGIVELRFDMTGFEAAMISFAYGTGDLLPSSATVEWSVDGGLSYTAFTTLASADYRTTTLVALDLAEIGALRDAADVRVRLRYSADGGSASTSTLSGVFDNVRIEARRIADGYEAWRMDRFGDLLDPAGAPGADPWQRGIPNLLEYALGLDLLPNARAGLPVMHDGHVIAFTRRASVDVRILVETSDSLAPGSWTAIATLEPGADAWSGPAHVQDSAAGEIQHVEVTHPDGPISASTPRFVQVRVEIDD
ncbi:MAG: PKD domain-containing protein [Opitutales bacterium]|nr:PKD domain-containing protein [Opitutales bacterium]